MNRIILSVALAGAFMTAGCATATEPNFSVVMPMDASHNGEQAFIVDFDSGEKIDSALVTDGTLDFKGNIDKASLARMIIAGNRGPIFILEPGKITFDTDGDAHGTDLNEKLNKFGADAQKLVAEFRSLPDDSLGRVRGEQIIAEYNNRMQSMIDQNANNPVGLYFLLDQANSWQTLADFDSNIARYPVLGGSKRIAKMRSAMEARAATSPGNMFKDFEITYNGETKRLSDYVGKGKYTLVDFWASWCGPCIRATKTLKELYAKYADKGLDFLGVAVWDEPENTLAAVESHELPWPQIINAQSIATDVYGIPAIPCIILFDPEGRIVSRDKQGQELIDDVNAAMAPPAAE